MSNFKSILASASLVLLVGCGSGSEVTTTPVIFEPTTPPKNLELSPAASISEQGTLSSFSYGLWNEPGPGNSRQLTANFLNSNTLFNPRNPDRNFRYISPETKTFTYKNPTGFKGIYSYKGNTGNITSDVTIQADFYSSDINPWIKGYIGKDKDIILEGDNFGEINFHEQANSNGVFTEQLICAFSEGCSGSGTIVGAFSNNSSGEIPQFIGGEVKIKGFGILGNSSRNNSLVGVFVAEKE